MRNGLRWLEVGCGLVVIALGRKLIIKLTMVWSLHCEPKQKLALRKKASALKNFYCSLINTRTYECADKTKGHVEMCSFSQFQFQ